jgi:hypothetical protein
MPGLKEPATAALVLLRWLQRLALLFSLALLAGASLCFAGRWDAMAVVTLPPFWGWTFLGILPLLAAWRIRSGWAPRTVLAAWLVSTVVWSDDLRCLIRSPFARGGSSSAEATQRRVRAVSLNCAGLSAAAGEIGRYKPDIVLLQESPASNEVARLCREWFDQEGGMIYGLDCSVLARGQVRVMASPRSLRFTWGEARLADGLVADVVSQASVVLDASAEQTAHSDHRMVIADLLPR